MQILLLKRAAAACALLFACATAGAGCRPGDAWRGEDKRLHFAGGAFISTVVTMHTGDPMTGFLAGTAAGVVKEAADAGGLGQCSGKDLLVTVAGAALGAWAGHIVVTRVQGRTTVAYVAQF